MESDAKHHEDKLKSLLTEFSETRKSIYTMIEEVEEISKSVKALFPEKFDARYRMIFQERVKATTELFKTLLDMRKEITKNIKDEIEIRRKVKAGDSFENIEEMINMSALVDKLEEMQESVKVKETKIKAKVDNAPNIDDIDISEAIEKSLDEIIEKEE